MPTQLIPLNLNLPARMGIHSEAVSGGLDSAWAAKAENCIFDRFSRLCARKAFKKVTTTAVLGNPDVNTLFEYVKDTNTTHIVSVTGEPHVETSWAAATAYAIGDVVRAVASPSSEYYLVCSTAGTSHATTEPTWNTADAATTADNGTLVWTTVLVGRICTGTATLTERTGSLVLPDSNVQFTNFEGNVIGAVQAYDPIFWDGVTTNFKTLHSQIPDSWAASTAYVLGDIVKAVATPTTDYYLVCRVAGTSGGSEPTWTAVDGGDNADGTVTWTTVTYPKGRCIMAAYGRVWILDEDRTTIKYSALGLSYDFSELNGGGVIDTTAIFGRNDDFVSAIATFNNNLVIFSRFNTCVYSNINDPTNLTIVDQVVGTGCIARDTVQNIGNDIIFLSYSGLRSLGRTVQLEKVPMQDLSVNIRNELISEANANLVGVTNDTAIKSVYSAIDGIYVLRTGDYYFVFDFKKSFPSDSDVNYIPPRITTWAGGFGAQSICMSRDGTMNVAKSGVVGNYDGYAEWGVDPSGVFAENIPYLMSYRSAWTHMGEVAPELVNRIKMVKKIYGNFQGGIGYTVDFVLGYDFSDGGIRRSKLLGVSAGDEWSLGEWGTAEWSGNTESRNAFANLSGSGERLQLGIDVNINGAEFCLQTLVLFIKLGRLERGSTKL